MSSVVLTSTPAALAAAAKFALAALRHRRRLGSRDLDRLEPDDVVRHLVLTSSSVGSADGLISVSGDEREALIGLQHAADLALLERERLGRDGRREAEAGERLVAREQAGVADGQAARRGDAIEVGRVVDVLRRPRRPASTASAWAFSVLI